MTPPTPHTDGRWPNSTTGAGQARTTSPRRAVALASAAALVGLTLAACNDNSDDDANGNGNVGENEEEITLNVGTMPLADLAPFYLAIEEGLFDDAGIEVDVVISSAGAAQIASVMAGELDLTYSNFVSVVQGVDQGLPLMAIRENNRSGPQGIYVRDDSDITDPEDLAGHTIAINSLGNIQELTSNAVLDTYGVGPDDVQFVEMPPPDMEAALEAGHVDAAWMVEPFLTRVESDDMARRVVSAFEGPTEDIPVAGWVTTETAVAENAEAIDRFVAVLDEAMEMAEADPSILADVIPTYTEIPADQAAELSEPSLTATSDLTTLADLESLMVEYDLVPNDVDIAQIIYEP